MRELEFPCERTGVSPLGNCVWPNDGMDGVRMRSFIVRFVFVSDTACRVPTYGRWFLFHLSVSVRLCVLCALCVRFVRERL